MCKRIFWLFLTLLGLGLSSCKNYLDIVPEGTATVDDAFKRPSEALNFLYSLYSFLPPENYMFDAIGLWGTDEMATPWDRSTYYAKRLMRGELGSSAPFFDYWTNSGPISMYDGIRQCYVFLENIDKTPGFAETEKTRMKGEATFIIAYLHFMLLRQYGPIVLIREAVPLDAPDELYYGVRSPYDECVNFIVSKLDEAKPSLPSLASITSSEYGRVSNIVCEAIKSRVLLYAASPLVNGNNEYYANFKDKNGQPLMSLTVDPEKWKRAVDASLLAIQEAENSGVALYETSQNISDPLKKGETSYRYSMVDPWNKELIWGYSKSENYYGWQRHSAPRFAADRDVPYNGQAPTLRIVEEYLTENGLPIEVDPSFDYNNRYKLDGETIKLHHHREPRFYASIGYDRGSYEFAGTTVTLQMRYNEFHGYNANTGANNYSPTGYLVKKGVHPQSIINASQNQLVLYPWPIIRLAEVYLNYAEALNEYSGTSAHSTVIEYLDKIRKRAGIPGIIEAWSRAGKGSFTKEEMRDVIRKERRIELAFEGHRFWDIRRWKLGNDYFNVPVRGWTITGETAEAFYQPRNTETRVFVTPGYYLLPIKLSELEINKNLVQNPGWN